LGFAVFDRCVRGFVTAEYATAILGTELGRKAYHYRVGYCPCVEEDGFLIAKTLLLPGMNGTPEASWARNNVSRRKYAELRDNVDELEYGKLVESLDFGLLKRFHDGGIPQVVELNREVFRF